MIAAQFAAGLRLKTEKKRWPFADAPTALPADTGSMIKILLVDDDPHIRRGLRMNFALEADFVVVGEAGDGWEALRLARELQPDVAVLDVRLPSLDGLSVAERLRQAQPRCAIIMLTLYDEPAHRSRAEQAGVAAFLSKSAAVDGLKHTIRRITCAKGGQP